MRLRLTILTILMSLLVFTATTDVYAAEVYSGDFFSVVREATELSEPTKLVNVANNLVSDVASFIVQVLSYFITAFLVVRELVDMVYIILPFTRAFLHKDGNNASMSMGNQMSAAQQGGMGLNMSGASQPTQSKLVSAAAIRAVQEEQSGSVWRAFKVYIKDMVVTLVLTTALLTLAITGSLMDLGFMAGDILVEFIRSIKDMI